MEKLLETLGIATYISHICGEQDVANKKPAPDMALHILEKTSTKPMDAIVVGDTVFDIQMGKSAGCRTCAVTYGNHSEGKLITSHPDYMISDFMDLFKIVDNEARD